MGLLDRLRFGTKRATQVKEPTFPVTTTSNWLDYAETISESDNYLDQYFGWTYRAINIISDAVVGYEPQLYQGDDVVVENELLNDLQHFNPHQTLADARALKMIHKRLTGLAFWVMFESEDKEHKVEFYTLNPQNVSMKRDQFGLPQHYEYRDGVGKKHYISPKDIIVFREPHPQDFLKGMSPLQASKYSHNNYEFAMKYNMNMFANMGRPDGFLIADGISEPDRKRLEKQLKSKFGGYNNNSKMGVANQALQWLEITKNQRDLEFIKGIEMMKKEILAMHGVPSILIDPSEASYANASEAQRLFQRYTIKPELEKEVSVFNEQLIPKYYATSTNRTKSLVFKSLDPVEKDKEKISLTTVTQYEKGVITQNEARAILGFEETDNGDTYFQNPQQQLIEQIQLRNDDSEKHIKTIKKQLEDLPSFEDQKTLYRERLKDFFHNKSITEEVSFIRQFNGYLNSQLIRVLDKTTKSKKNVSMKANIEHSTEVQIGEEMLSAVYAELARDSVATANKLTVSSNIALSKEAQKQLLDNLAFMLGEVNTTTKADLQKIIANAVETGLHSRDLSLQIISKYDDYQFGQPNVDLLKGYDIWISKVDITSSGQVVERSGNIYNTMLERITNSSLTDEQKTKAGQALFNVIKVSNDPLANSLENIIPFSISGINTDIAGISHGRAMTIARTETAKLRNFVQRDVYFQDKYVAEVEWLSAKDSATRLEHLATDGKTVKKGDKFQVGDDLLEYPADPSGSPENVINCRCTLIPVIE